MINLTGSNGGRGLLAGLSLAVALVAGGTHAQEKQPVLNGVDPDGGFSRVWREYEDMDATFVRGGVARSGAQMQRVRTGQTKQQLVAVAGQPVAADKNGAWYFNIELPLPQKNKLVCQYRVDFDADNLVESTFWRRPQCADIVRAARR